MDWEAWLKEMQHMTWDRASLEANTTLASKLNADVLRAAEARLAFEDEPSTFLRALRDLGGRHD